MRSNTIHKSLNQSLSFFIMIFLLIFTLSSGFAQEYLSLRQAIGIGLQNNFSIRIAKNQAKIDEKNASLGNAGFLPNLDVQAGQDRSVEDSRQEFITGNISDTDNAIRESRQAEAALNWTIFDGLKMFATYNKLQEIQELGAVSVKSTIELRIAEIINAYYDIAQQSKNMEFSRNNLDLSRERLKIAETNYQIGAGSRLDVLQARVDLNSDSSAFLRQRAVLKQSKIHLNQLLARDAEIPFATSDSIELTHILNYDTLKNEMLEHNSLLRISRQNRKIAELNLKEIRSEWFPKLNFRTNYQWSKLESQSGFLLENRTSGYTYGLSLSMNLFNGFNTLRRSQNAKIEIRNRDIEWEKLRSEIEADLANMFEEYQNNLQRVSLEQENVKVASENLDVALEQFRIGSINSIELREAQQNFLESETRLISTKFDAKRAETELLRLSSQLLKTNEVNDF